MAFHTSGAQHSNDNELWVDGTPWLHLFGGFHAHEAEAPSKDNC